jgi:hypothetical protein
MSNFFSGINNLPTFTPPVPQRPIAARTLATPVSADTPPAPISEAINNAIVVAGINNAIQVATFEEQQNWQVVGKLLNKKFKFDDEG